MIQKKSNESKSNPPIKNLPSGRNVKIKVKGVPAKVTLPSKEKVMPPKIPAPFLVTCSGIEGQIELRVPVNISMKDCRNYIIELFKFEE